MTKSEKEKFRLHGRLRVKSNYYHVLIDTKHPVTNEVIRHSQSTKLKAVCDGKKEEKSNKAMAEEMLIDFERKWSKFYLDQYLSKKTEITFNEYLWEWLERKKSRVVFKTFEGYKTIIRRIDKYFSEKNILLEELTIRDLQKFYEYCNKTLGISNNTIIKEHKLIKSALECARKEELISKNPADYIDSFKKEDTEKVFLKEEKMEKIIQAIDDNKISTPAFLASKYGFRRGEAVGLRWSDIDFENNTITVCNSVVDVENKDKNAKNKKKQVNRLKLKTKASFRVLPLLMEVKDYLLNLRKQQKENRERFKTSYNTEYLDNICVDQLGNLVKLDYVTKKFKKIVTKLNYEKVTFHTLRHSVATLLHKHGFSVKIIQYWLGHSNISTTLDTYTHLSLEDLSDVANTFNNLYKQKKSYISTLNPAAQPDQY
ncbi:tyrosine-type recombinase/integrase [Fusobacterium sp.]|uniref:tyrosine-type recombinase/integrase n=1 Tax=Fusobacterium sp. TaxID=68766 RepID=UPI001D5F43B8|nr:tyrosine-type recombinase/integrase [Fusobacterium sp.]MBS5789836.1 site-specific integrase [Fusobacterium sp.]